MKNERVKKFEKPEVFYTEQPDRQGRSCQLCKFFVEVPGTEDMAGICDRVWGIVGKTVDSHCNLWKAKRPNRLSMKYIKYEED